MARMHRIASIAGFVATALALSLVSAQDDVTELNAEPVQRYNIEIIAFAHTDIDTAEERFIRRERPAPFGFDHSNQDLGFTDVPIAVDSFEESEQVPPDAARVAPGVTSGNEPLTTNVADDPLEYLDPLGNLAIQSDGLLTAHSPAKRGFSFRLLAQDELLLGDAHNIIDRLGAYTLLGHGGWQQDGLEQSDAHPFDLAYLGIKNPTGTIKLYRGRFLHATIDLAYRQLPPSRSFGEVDFALEDIPIAQRYTLTTERNAIRRGELHYIDHPAFGLLIMVTPAAEEEEAAEFEPVGPVQPAA
jgi:hypothetical protein